MIELIEANWLLILLAVLVGFVVAWFLMSGSRKTKVTREESDEADTGARRNQALIDSPPAAAKDAAPPPPEPVAADTDKPAAPAGNLGGAGAAVGMAAATDAEPAPDKPKASKPKASKVAPVPPVNTGMAGGGAAKGAALAEDQAAKAPATGESGGDDLTRLKGVGPKLATQLRELGVTSFAQIASWNEADIDRIDDQLGRFKGRIRRDDWVEQAKMLSSGDTAAYEARFGKL